MPLSSRQPLLNRQMSLIVQVMPIVVPLCRKLIKKELARRLLAIHLYAFTMVKKMYELRQKLRMEHESLWKGW